MADPASGRCRDTLLWPIPAPAVEKRKARAQATPIRARHATTKPRSKTGARGGASWSAHARQHSGRELRGSGAAGHAWLGKTVACRSVRSPPGDSATMSKHQSWDPLPIELTPLGVRHVRFCAGAREEQLPCRRDPPGARAPMSKCQRRAPPFSSASSHQGFGTAARADQGSRPVFSPGKRKRSTPGNLAAQSRSVCSARAAST